MKPLNEYPTPETDGIREDIFERLTAQIEDRPFTRDKLEDGNWKFVHHLHAKQAFDNNLKKLRDLERRLALCRDALKAVLDNYDGQLDCLADVIKESREAIEATEAKR